MVLKEWNAVPNQGARAVVAFRTLAANPVGRVLLYRLLIEIRRQDAANNGCCGDGITVTPAMSSYREWARKIDVQYVRGKLEFEPMEGAPGSVIRLDPDKVVGCRCLRINGGATIDTSNRRNSLDGVLFHEMLHWFQLLRHPVRFFDEGIEACRPSRYAYLSRCYYGNDGFAWELFTWGGLNHQEMRTILGTPNYNTPAELALFHSNALLPNDPGNCIGVNGGFLPQGCEFYNGDDLSENAYRMAKHAVDPAHHPVRMRFGHGDVINPIDISAGIPDRFQLAHLVATNCCNAIVTANGAPAINNWNLVVGEAAE
jgi:hypothetical protein